MKHDPIILLINNMKAHYILLAALCGLAGCRDGGGKADGANRKEMPPLKVSVMNLEQRTVELKSSWFGHLRGVEQADIRPQVSGTLLRQVYLDGSICNKGELLFEIDPASYQAAVDREEANLAVARAVKLQAEASLDRVRKDLDRYDKLIKTGAISFKNLTDAQQNLKEMQAALKQAEAGIKQAEASLENARINLDRTKVRAPFRGLASKATASVGDLISASGSPLTTMSSIDPIRVDFSITGKQVLSRLMDGSVDVKTGRMGDMPDFELILEDGSVFEKKGKVVSVDSEVSRSTGTVNFIGHIPNPDLKLRSGMAVRVRAVTGTEKDALLVPARALVSSMNHRSIMVVAPDKTPRRIDVQPGETVVLDMPNGSGGTAPMLMQIVTGTVKPISESLKEMGYNKTTDAPVIVEGGMMAAQYSKANSLMREHGATVGFGKVVPVPFVYTTPVSTTPSVTAK